MKRVTVFLIMISAVLLSQESKAQIPQFEINGKIEGAPRVLFVLQKNVDGKSVEIGRAISSDGIFRIVGGPLDYPRMVILETVDKKRLIFYLENSVITITGRLDSLSNARVSGSKTNEEYISFITTLKPFEEKLKKLKDDIPKAISAHNVTWLNAAQKQAEDLQKKIYAVMKDFVVTHPASFVSPSILQGIVSKMSKAEMESIIASMSPEVAKTAEIVELKFRIEALKNVQPGKKAPDFTLPDVNGKPVSLSSQIGPKALLIDFWAAWCAPCRNENPNVVSVYQKYHKKGFDIIGVSLDRNKTDWTAAINDDKLIWNQVSDLKYFNNTAAKLYAVNAIPANFLLDKDGIIVAVNLRGEALSREVKKLVGK
jgi:peroxiredoxin